MRMLKLIFTLLICSVGSFSCANLSDDDLKWVFHTLESNMRSTDLTALVNVTNVATAKVDNALAIRYSADVIDSYYGIKTKKIVYIFYTEIGDEVDLSERGLRIVSACKDEKPGEFYLADIAYVLPGESKVIEKAKDISMRIKSGQLSFYNTGEKYACETMVKK